MSSQQRSVLGVDLASKRWRDIGAALLTFTPEERSWKKIVPSVIPWPNEKALTPTALAEAIDNFAQANRVMAVSIDGPQGWRDPAAPAARGVGRGCERHALTPGKTGPWGRTYPSNQIGWISFSIETFDRLLERPHVHLVNDPKDLPRSPRPEGEYFLLECFPTVTWRSCGLNPLPGKGKRPDTAPFASRLATCWGLPPFPPPVGHDDLQAVVAALPAAALLGVGVPIAHGVSARMLPACDHIPEHRVEGIIWDAHPND